MRAGVKDILLAAAIAVVVLLHGAWLARITPFNMGDEGYLYYIAWRVQQGARLFEDIELFTYAPGLFQLWGEWFDLFGPTVASGRALGVLLAALNVALSYGVARALGLRFGPAIGIAAVILLSYPWLFRGHILLLSQLALLLSLFAQSSAGRLPLALLGALVIVGAAVRIDAAATAGALAFGSVMLRLEAHRSLAKLGSDVLAGLIGATLAGLAVALAYSQVGVLAGWLGQLRDFAGFAHSRSVAWYKLPFPRLGGPGSDLMTLLMLSSAAWPLLGVAAAFYKRWQSASPEWRKLALLSLFAVVNLPQFLIERPDGAHLADRAFAIVLLIAGLLSAAGHNRHLRVVGAAGMIWLAALVVWSFRDAGTLHGAARVPALAVMLAGEPVPLPEDRHLVVALQYLDRNLGPQESLASLPFAPGANFVLKRPMPSPQVNFFPFNQQRVGSEDALRRGLAAPTLRYVLLQPDFQMSPDPRANISCYAPRLAADLNRFGKINQSERWWVLQKGGRSIFPARAC
ncbi:MAG: hypothetical protein A2790_04965 [Phenylobacterium sp. RIFCSPHIGHO2_01_FULL_69_31]|nr:MAG: hypothetical protein A2790_04965 [Phenylobacterium sp. RIFCSPHIGHO2_01_FULL_69_31]